jgi:type II secretory pathway pseudopilin PulG
VSLVEATIILMVFAILTAVIAPTAGGYIKDAQQASAKADVDEISSALAKMLADVGEAWFVRNGARTGTAVDHGSPAHGVAARVDMMVTAGAIPVLAAAARPAGTDWDDAVNHAAIQRLENYLLLNIPSNLAANAYRTSASMNGAGNFDTDAGMTFNADFGWRGAYLAGPIGPDPWGSRYAVNVEFLARAQGTIGSGSRMDVVVLSAGANARTDTQFEVDGSVPGNDDIVSPVSGGTR